MNIEYITVPMMEVKSLESGQFEGYGSTFGNVDLGGDVVMKGAFTESLARWRKEGEWPQMFWMHRPDQIPGVWLDMSEDSKGLKTKGEVIETVVGKDLQVMLRRRAVRALSIGFSLDEAKDFEFRDGVRLLKRINLWEVSPVSMPMNPKAKISTVKARLHANGVSITDVKRDLEKLLRAKGFSKSEAIGFASRAFAPEDDDFGATPRFENGDEPGAIPDESRRDAGEANGDAERAAKALADKVLASCLRLPSTA
jgi:HK97 family phage prohead protease